MIARSSATSAVMLAVLAATAWFSIPERCFAQTDTTVTVPAAEPEAAPSPIAETPPQAAAPSAPKPATLAGNGGIGGQLGFGKIIGEGDYSEEAGLRFSFAGHWRYQMNSWLRWQFSPAFTWAGYDEKARAPFRDLNFPNDSTKAEYLTLLLPVTVQLQLTSRRGPWQFHLGLGSGAYRVWVQNRRKVLKDPVSLKLHRGIYPGASAQIGAERFLKALPSTSIEITLDGHYVLAQRDEQFPSGFNDKLMAVGLRVGGNYYFSPDRDKKPASGIAAP